MLFRSAQTTSCCRCGGIRRPCRLSPRGIPGRSYISFRYRKKLTFSFDDSFCLNPELSLRHRPPSLSLQIFSLPRQSPRTDGTHRNLLPSWTSPCAQTDCVFFCPCLNMPARFPVFFPNRTYSIVRFSLNKKPFH